jgi:hypothetical protein
VSVNLCCKHRKHVLLVAVTHSNVTSGGTTLSAATVEDDFLVTLGLVPTVFGLESIFIHAKRSGYLGEWKVDGGWDGALNDLVWFTNINQVVILMTSG